jgi:hypothetical protein
MIWAFLVAAVTTLYLALRFRSFRSWVEPALTIVVAIGLAAALLIWFVEDRAVPGATDSADGQASPAEIIGLSDMQAEVGQTATSFRVTGLVTNHGDVALQSFRLDMALADCPTETCREVGSDDALIVLRILPGQTLPFTTFAVFPRSDLAPVTAPRWTWDVRDTRAVSP